MLAVKQHAPGFFNPPALMLTSARSKAELRSPVQDTFVDPSTLTPVVDEAMRSVGAWD